VTGTGPGTYVLLALICWCFGGLLLLAAGALALSTVIRNHRRSRPMSYPAIFTTPGVRAFAEAVDTERQLQIAKFGDQHHPDGTGNESQLERAEFARRWCESALEAGYGTWADILGEEVAEAEAERDPVRLRAELIQVAAVCAAWIADLDSRKTQR
jgi:hypothetical protein